MASPIFSEFGAKDTEFPAQPAADRAGNTGLGGEYVYGVSNENSAWDVYNNEARKVDNELVKDWTTSLNFLLVFAAIFSAVLAAFIIESKRLLEPDYNAIMVDVIIFYANRVAGSTQDVYIPPVFRAPNSAVSINSLLFGSLASSLVAALASVVSLQWVAGFDAAITRGGSSPRERALRRHFRYAGVEKWKMSGIIAALPLLLYFSVLLFFIGVTQWMLIINATVGYILLGGALIVASFYFSSTIVGVFFVSAPFKTPLSRWIYAVYHLSYVITYWIITMASAEKKPQWVVERWESYRDAEKREDSAVDSRSSLRFQAMRWLARQISLSEDSRRRLFLLVKQLVEWPDEELDPELEETPWISILNLLAQKHQGAFQSETQTKEDEKDLALLATCASRSGLSDLVLPTDKHYYEHNVNSDTYWSQYCIISDQSPTPPPLPSVGLLEPPHAIFLLIRDLPVPSPTSGDEMEITLRLAKWRNSKDKPPGVWQIVFSSTRTLSNEFFEFCIIMLSNYLTANERHHADMLSKGAFGPVIAVITDRATKSGITSGALTAFVRLFELSILQENKSPSRHRHSNATLQGPLYYARKLLSAGEQAQGIHRKSILLLAMDIGGLSGSEQQRRLQDLRAMIWVSPLKDPSSNIQDDRWDDLMQKYDYTAELKDLEEEIDHDWIFRIDRSPELIEAIISLTETHPKTSQVGLKALSSCSRKSVKHMLALLHHFDEFLHRQVDSKPALRILESLCNILQMDESGKLPTLSEDNFSMYIFKTAYVRVIAHRALGIDHIDEEEIKNQLGEYDLVSRTASYMFWNVSLRDPRSVWQLRAWTSFGPEGHNNHRVFIPRVFGDALRNPNTLRHIERILAERTQCHHDQGLGHFLTHLQISFQPKMVFRSDKRIFGAISLKKVELPPIIALLSLSNIEDLSFLSLQQVDKACLTYVWTYIQSLKTNQSHMLQFLTQFPRFSSREHNIQLGSHAILLKSIEDAIGLPPEDYSIDLFIPLYHRVPDLSNPHFARLSDREEEQRHKEITTLAVHGERIAYLALARYSTVTVSGNWRLRLLSCARPSWGRRPATGWWLPYD